MGTTVVNLELPTRPGVLEAPFSRQQSCNLSEAEIVAKFLSSSITPQSPIINSSKHVAEDESKLESSQSVKRAEFESDLPGLQSTITIPPTQQPKSNVRLSPRVTFAQISRRIELRSSGRSADAVIVPSKKAKASHPHKLQSANNGTTRTTQCHAVPVLSSPTSPLVFAKQETPISLPMECSFLSRMMLTATKCVSDVAPAVRMTDATR